MLFLLLPALAAAPLDRAAYGAKFPLADVSHPDFPQVQACLAAWSGHPFAKEESRTFRVIAASVRVMGFGSGEITDDVATSYPQLVLVRPSTSVLTRTTWKLLNPNGWYCFDMNVAVLAKGEIELGCGARLADGTSGKELSPGSGGAGSTTVLGDITVRRAVGCDD